MEPGRTCLSTDAAAAAGASWLDVEAPVVRAAVGLALQNWPRLAGSLALRFNGFLDRLRDTRGSAGGPADGQGCCRSGR